MERLSDGKYKFGHAEVGVVIAKKALRDISCHGRKSFFERGSLALKKSSVKST
jgi:hypothetical protein